MFNEPVVFVDIETSGGSYKNSRIIEFAAIRVENNQIVEQYQTMINPGQRIPYWITNVTGITDDDVRDAPYFDDVAYEINRILEGAIFIAHNVRFDLSFVKNQLEAVGYSFNPKLLCTVRLSRFLYAEHKGHSLEKLIARHNIPVDERHRAMADTKAIYDFARLAHAEHGDEKFQLAIKNQLKTKTLPPNLDQSYIAKISQSPGVYIFEDESGIPIYIGKSVNLRARVMSHFASDTKVAKEMKISLNTHKVRTIETDSEIEALLLESEMIKEHKPIYNVKLRRKRMQTVLFKQTNENGYSTIELKNTKIDADTDLSNIYGVYDNKAKAKSRLEEHLRTFQLCTKLLGLEKAAGSCFRYQLHRCYGACVGKENTDLYNQRVELALEKSKIETWPYTEPVKLPVSRDKKLIIDNWVITGSEDADGKVISNDIKAVFDIDTYRILRNFIKASISTAV